MFSKMLALCLFPAILIHNLQSQSTDTGAKSDLAPASKKIELKKLGLKSKEIEDRKKLLKAYEEFEAQVSAKITSIIKNLHQEDECEHGENVDGTCRKKSKTDSQILHEDDLTDKSLLERIENIHEILLALIPLATSSLETKASSAHVPHPVLRFNLNDSVNISCDSDSEGKPLSFCFWERNSKGQREVIHIHDDVTENEGKTGFISVGKGLEAGKCGLVVENLKRHDFGAWSCTLVTRSGGIFRGQVTIEEVKEQGVYFGTYGVGLKYYSLTSSQFSTVPNSSFAVGVAVDCKRSKIYMTYWNEIFRCNRNGTDREVVLDTKKYGLFEALAFDWVSDNVYATSLSGFILACDGRRSSTFTCATVRQEDGPIPIKGLALNPIEGYMYWTSSTAGGSGSIMRSQMDGRDAVTIVKNLQNPYGIAIDFASHRLYWADSDANQIQWSDLSGRDVQLLVQLPGSSEPWGVAVLNGRIYWSTRRAKTLQSQAQGESATLIHYNGTSPLYHLAVGPNAGLPTNRSNPCDGQTCPTVCVLTANSFRCLG